MTPMRRFDVYRLGMVRFGASVLVCLTTGVLNRFYIADLGQPAWMVSLRLSLLYFAAPLALLTGYLSDVAPIWGRRRTPYVLLWVGLSCLSVSLLPLVGYRVGELGAGTLAVILSLCFGLGVKASNLTISALLADRLDADQRGPALGVVWGLAIFGFVVAGTVVGFGLLPWMDDILSHPQHLSRLFAGISLVVFVVTVLCVWRTEPAHSAKAVRPRPMRYGLVQGIRQVLASPVARAFFLFLVVADFSFFLQEFILEPFGAQVFSVTIDVTTSYNTYLYGGTLLGMLGVGALVALVPDITRTSVAIAGCALGVLSFSLLILAAAADASALVMCAALFLGVGKGTYNIAVAHLVMDLAVQPVAGLVLGLWGALGGLAVAAGSCAGGVLLSVASTISPDLPSAYMFVFLVEILGLLLCIALVFRIRWAQLSTASGPDGDRSDPQTS